MKILFPIWLGWVCSLAAAQPLLPEPPLGTSSAAFAGGGVAYRGGVNSIFVNPAALHIQGGQEIELGMMGMADGFSPYLLYGARLPNHTSYAAGYYYDNRSEGKLNRPARQGMLGGASWALTRKTTLGLSMHSQGTGAGIGLHGFGVDADGGLLWQPIQIGWVGLTVKNIFESDIGQQPTGYRSRRCYLSAVGIRKSHLHFWGIDFQEPDFYYELRAAEFPPQNFVNAFSLASKFTPEGKLGFRSTVLVSLAGAPSLVLGTFLNLPVGHTFIGTAYTFDTGGGDDLDVGGERDLSHSLSVNLHLHSQVQALPPAIEIHVDRSAITPDSLGEAHLFFQLLTNTEKKKARQVEDDAPQKEPTAITSWKVEINQVLKSGKTGELVKAFEGKDLPPRMIRWDWKIVNLGEIDQTEIKKAKPTPEGFYAYRFSALDASGNESVTAWQLLELKVPLHKDMEEKPEIPEQIPMENGFELEKIP